MGDEVTCAVDYDRRALIAPNHTMTHVFNHALRDVLCGSVEEWEALGGLRLPLAQSLHLALPIPCDSPSPWPRPAHNPEPHP